MADTDVRVEPRAAERAGRDAGAGRHTHARPNGGRRGGVRPAPVPGWLLPLALLAVVYLLAPLLALGARVPWGRLPAVISSPAGLDAIGLSLGTCLVALAVDLAVGVPLAVLLSRSWRGVRLVRVLVALPLSVPPVVAGLALLVLFGRRGPLGSLLDSVGVTLAFTPAAVVMAQVFVSLPFLVLTLEAALRARPGGLEETAASLGAPPTRTLTRVTLPLVTPGLARGAALALARCLGEFGATLTFAGSLQGVTRTMSLEVYLARETDEDLSLVLGAVLLALALVVVTLTEVRVGRVWARVRARRAMVLARRAGEWAGRAGGGGPAAGRPSRAGALAGTAPAAPALDRPAPAAGTTAPAVGVTSSGRRAPDTPAVTGLDLHVDGRLDERGWHLALDVPAGQTVAVMGHNGAGKSTLAGVVAGFVALDSGHVRLGAWTVDGPGEWVPASRRPAVLLGQDPHLFPHMTVLDNVAFPLRARGVGCADARRRAAAELASFGLSGLAGRSAAELSGGEAARVALARALVARPEVIVLDEPTAALDVEARALVLRALAERVCSSGATVLLVTHLVTDALALADRLVIVEGGAVAESGAPAEVLASPSSRFGARLAGLNVVAGRARLGDGGLVSVAVGESRLVAVDTTGRVRDGAQVALLVAPEAIGLHAQVPPGASPRSVLEGRVVGARDEGGVVLVDVAVEGAPVPLRARVTTVAWAELAGRPGMRVWCAVKATQVRVVVSAHGSGASADA